MEVDSFILDERLECGNVEEERRGCSYCDASISGFHCGARV